MTSILDRAKAALGFGPRPEAASTAGPGKSELQQNAERALRLKQEAGSQTHIPEHRTSHEGGVGEPQVGYTDTMVGKEPTYTPNLKRSHNARTGDA